MFVRALGNQAAAPPEQLSDIWVSRIFVFQNEAAVSWFIHCFLNQIFSVFTFSLIKLSTPGSAGNDKSCHKGKKRWHKQLSRTGKGELKATLEPLPPTKHP